MEVSHGLTSGKASIPPEAVGGLGDHHLVTISREFSLARLCAGDGKMVVHRASLDH